MKEAALDSLYKYITQDKVDDLDLALNFNTFSDLLSTELIKEVKRLQALKKELKIKFTENEPQVGIIDEQIIELYSYLKESVVLTKKDITAKRKNIELTVADAKKELKNWPTKEKELKKLNREFIHYEKMYGFLSEKRIETAIAASSELGFHRIIEKASIPKETISSKANFVLIVSGFIGAIIGIIVSIVIALFDKKISSREDLERISSIPIAGSVRNVKKFGRLKKREEFMSLTSTLMGLNIIKKNQILLVSSAVSNEGKTFVAKNISRSLSDYNWKTLFIDFNFRNYLRYRLS
jgi:hypothetical protein